MGYFSTEHVFTAHAASSSLIDEEDRKNTVKGLLLQASITDDSSLAEAVTLGFNLDLYARAKSMLRYATRADTGYVYGLPEPTHPYEEYLPIVPLMHDKVWFDETDQPVLEETTHRILKRLAIDSKEVKEEYLQSVEEGIANGDRPGPGKLDDWDFFIHFAAPIHGRSRGTREYLFNFYRWIGEKYTWTTREDYVDFLNGGMVGEQPTSNFHLSEGEGSNTDWRVPATGYEIVQQWSYITEVTKSGSYTPPGWSEALLGNRMYSKIYKLGDADYGEGIDEVHGSGALKAPSAPLVDETYHDYAVFTRQNIDDTYTQVLVMGPAMWYLVNLTDENGKTEYQYVNAPLFPDDPEVESEFRLPIMVPCLKNVMAMHREELLQEALCATVFLVSHEKVKWYQQTFFKWLIVIIVIIVVVIAQQYHLLAYLKEMAGAAFAVGATATGLAFAAMYVALAFALGFLISFAGGLIGGEWGQLFIIAASIYMAGLNPFANVGNTWSTLMSQAGWGSAVNFLGAVMPFLRVGEVLYQGYVTRELEDEWSDFTKTKQEKYDELKDAYDMMGEMPTGIDSMFIVQTFKGDRFNETPDTFFARSLNANPGLLGYDLINNFTDIALALPEDDNEGNIIDSQMKTFARQRGAA
jgi:hypothetical protein